MTRAGVSNLTSALIERGLIVRRPSATDGRGAVLSMTEAGRAAITEIFRAHNEREAEWAALLTPRSEPHCRDCSASSCARVGSLRPAGDMSPSRVPEHDRGCVDWNLDRRFKVGRLPGKERFPRPVLHPKGWNLARVSRWRGANPPCRAIPA